jgi:hypothetical protein
MADIDMGKLCPELHALQGLYTMIKKAPNPNAHRELMRRFEEKAYFYFAAIARRMLELAEENERLKKQQGTPIGRARAAWRTCFNTTHRSRR